MPDSSSSQAASTSNQTETVFPKVSVIIRVFDRREYIAEAIESVLAQTYPNIEIIVVDNGSPTPIKDVLEPYWPKIRYVYKPRGSVGSAANVGVAYATSEVVAFLDDDDLWDPRMIEGAVTRLSSDDRPDVVWVGWRLFYGRDLKGRFEPAEEPLLRAIEAGGDLFRVLCERNLIPMCSAVTRRETLLHCGGFDESLSYGEDWDLWLRIIQKGARIVHLAVPYYFYRRHGDNVTDRAIPLCWGDIRILRKAVSSVGRPYRSLVRRSLASRYRRLGELFWQDGHWMRGTGGVVYSIVVNPFDRETVWHGADWIARKMLGR